MPPKKKADQSESPQKTAKPRVFYPNVVEIAPTNKTTCLSCDAIIEKGDFRVTEADASRSHQFRGGEGESRGYGVFKSYAHLLCHEPPAYLYPLSTACFKFPKKLTPAQKAKFEEWVTNRNERGAAEEDYYMRNKKWLVLVDCEGAQVYSKKKLSVPRAIGKQKSKSAKEAEDDDDEDEDKESSKKKSTKKTTAASKKRKRDEDEDEEDDYEEEQPKKKKLKAKK